MRTVLSVNLPKDLAAGFKPLPGQSFVMMLFISFYSINNAYGMLIMPQKDRVQRTA